MIIMGAGICQWFHGDATYRAILVAARSSPAAWAATAAAGRTTSARRSAGPITGWISLANALDWAPAAADHDRHRRTGTCTPTSGATTATRPTRSPRRWPRAPGRQAHRRHDRAVGAAGLDAVLPAVRHATRCRWPRTRRPPSTRARPPAPRHTSPSALHDGSLQLGHRGRRRPGELAAHAGAVAVATSWAPRPRATSTSCKHLLGTHSQRHGQREPRRRRGRPRWRGTTRPRRASSTCSLSADFRMTSTTLLSDIVLPAATWYEKHDLSSTDMHPFVHAFTPAIDPPWEAKSDFELFHLPRRSSSRDLARTHLGVRKDLVSVPLHARHRRRDGAAGRSRRSTGARRGSPASPGRTMPVFQVVERDYTAIADKLATVGPLADTPRLHRQERHVPGRGGGRPASPAKNGVMLGGAGDGRPAIDTDAKMAEAILTLLRHDERRTWRCRASARWRSGSARSSSTSPRARRRSGSPSPTPRSRRCRSSPRRSGRARRPAAGATRRSPSTSSGSSRSTP